MLDLLRRHPQSSWSRRVGHHLTTDRLCLARQHLLLLSWLELKGFPLSVMMCNQKRYWHTLHSPHTPIASFSWNVGVAPARQARFNTALRPAVPEGDKTPEGKEIDNISDKWAEVRFLSREEAESTLEPEWLEAYNRFYTKYDEDMVQMAQLAEKMAKVLEPPKVQKKTEGQKKRDAWAIKQAREASRAAAAAAVSGAAAAKA
jgi:hypothetical protein